MKLRILTISTAFIILTSACSKEKIEPVLEIFVTTKASQNWTTVEFQITNMNFPYMENGEVKRGPLLRNFSRPILKPELNSENTTLIHNDTFWSTENIIGAIIGIDFIVLNNASENFIEVRVQDDEILKLTEAISFEPSKTYKVDIIIDLDTNVCEKNGLYEASNFQIKITEL